MSRGVFATVSSGYGQGARALWRWLGETWWLIKPLGLAWVIPASLVLWGLGLVLRVLVLLDILSALVERLRDGLLRSVTGAAAAMTASRLSYAMAPVGVLLLLPLVAGAGLIPKLGLSDAVPPHHGFEPEPDGGYFRRAARAYGDLAAAVWIGLWRHGVLFFPVALLVAVIMLPVAVGCTLLFSALTVLDWLSVVVEFLRRAVASAIHWLAGRTADNILSAMLFPLLLVGLLPVFLLVLLIPKFSTAGQQA